MADNNMFDEQGGGRRKRRRTDNGDAKTCPTSIHSLPRELVVEILARIAAHSWEDLTNARLSCKRWNELGNDGFVYKHASLAKLPIVQWKPETAENKRKRCLFFQKCVDVRNFEALYRRGLVDYLESREEYDALGFLKKAASAGHLTSQYALPKELVVEILARIAHSWEDLINARLSCRRWNELGNDGFVYKHASLAKLPIVPWKPEIAENKRKRCLFFQKCVDAGNFEALYRRGLVDYLGSREEYDALGCLKKAASEGHLASLYALCITSIFLGGERMKNGIRMLSEMMSKESIKEIRTAREKLRNIIHSICLRNFSFVKKPVCCTKHYGHARNGWGHIGNDNEDLDMKCKFCKCDKEISHIRKDGLIFDDTL